MSLFYKPSAATITVVDSFEDGDISEYDNDTDRYSVVSSRPTDGTMSMESNGQASSIYSATGLPRYPAQGDTFEWDFNVNSSTASDATVTFWFAVQNTSPGTAARADGYGAELMLDRPNWRIVLRDSGSTSVIASDTSFNTVAYDQTVTGQVKWETDGTITAKVSTDNSGQVSSISITDTTFSSGGLGWQTNDYSGFGITVNCDYARVVA